LTLNSIIVLRKGLLSWLTGLTRLLFWKKRTTTTIWEL